MQEKTNTTTEDLITRIEKEEAEDQIHKLKSVISENDRIFDNKCTENIEILRGKYELKDELNRVHE